MKKNYSLIAVFTFFTLFSCKNYEEERKFIEVKKLSDYKTTQFLPTLENKISADTNAIYCATMLYAWQEIKKAINAPLQIDKNFIDLTLLNQSKSHLNVLLPEEYSASGEIDGDRIVARAEFNKSLPFEIKLSIFDDLIFNDTNVASFGTQGYDYEEKKIIKVAYYKNDNDFIIKLLPADKQHEIVLYMPEKNYKTLAEMLSAIKRKTEKGTEEAKNEKFWWKYYLADEDEVVIPKFNFNIETNYSTLEGKSFSTIESELIITEAWQRTAFLLDESGAEIESEVEIVVEETEDEEYEKPRPKKMRFNKPFFLILKRVDSENPYFAIWVANIELMVKE